MSVRGKNVRLVGTPLFLWPAGHLLFAETVLSFSISPQHVCRCTSFRRERERGHYGRPFAVRACGAEALALVHGDPALVDFFDLGTSAFLWHRLVQFLHELPNGWRSIPHVLSLLWGPALEVRQQQPQPPLAVLQLQQQQKLLQQQQREADSVSAESAVSSKQMTTIMVMYLGGVTYAEIAAIRRLNELEIEQYQRHVKEQEQLLLQQSGGGPLKPPTRRRYIIVTTDVINYKKLLGGCGEEAEDPCERFGWRNRDA